MNKENFINILSNMKPEDINRLLLEKGIEKRLIVPVWKISDEEKEKLLKNKKER